MEADGQILTIHTPEANPTLLNDLCDPMFGVYDAESEIDPELGASCCLLYTSTEELDGGKSVKYHNQYLVELANGDALDVYKRQVLVCGLYRKPENYSGA